MHRYLLELGVATAVSMSAIVATNGSGAVPTRPRDATATPGDGSAVVVWQAPPATSTHIETYTVTAAPGGRTVTVNGEQTGASVHGLHNGLSYAFTVRAENVFGASAGSSPTRPVTPEAEPPAPRDVEAIAGIGRAVVSWKPPNGSAYQVSAYTVIASGGQHATVAAGDTRATVAGLTDGARYTFSVDARTTIGPSAVSKPSAQVMMPPGAPSAPPGPDAFDGGRAIANYTVTTTPGAGQITVPARRGVIPNVTIGGLTNGTRYRFTVDATNALGRSVESAASNAVTPYGPPGAPTGVHATQHDGRVVVSWTAPTNDNGSSINQYRVTASPGRALEGIDAPHHSVTFEGLTSAKKYTFTVVALNDAANGPASFPSNVVTVNDPAPGSAG
jgi:hypothetical protein